MKKLLTILLIFITLTLQGQNLLYRNGHVYYYNNSTLTWTQCDTIIARLVGIQNLQLKSDTSTTDATAYWVNSQGFLKVETDPIYTNDSAKVIMWGDTINKISTAYDLTQLDFSEPLYRLDSSYIKSNIRGLNVLTDTTAEWVNRTIYISMTTDPQTPGSDVTGTGDISFPYATLEKAISTIKGGGIFSKITIQLDSGSFNYTLRCKAYLSLLLSKSNQNSTSGSNFSIIIKGQVVKETQAFTLVATTYPMGYKITGYSFADGYMLNKMLGLANGSAFLVPETNLSDTVWIASVSVPESAPNYNNVYRLNSTINFSSSTYNLSFQNYCGLTLWSVNANFTTSQHIINTQIWFSNITNSTTSTAFNLTNCQILSNKIITSNTGSNGAVTFLLQNQFDKNVVYRNVNRKTVGYGLFVKFPGGVSSNIISGYLVGYVSVCNLDNSASSQPNGILFKECGTCYSNGSYPGVPIMHSVNIFVAFKTDYLFNSGFASTSVRFQTNSYYQRGLISIYNPASLYKSYINPEFGGYIIGLGVYPEYQQKLSNTLANNSTDSISIGDKLYNRSIDIKYTIQRGTDYRYGTFKILYDGTAVLFDPGDYFPVTDIGVTLDGAYLSGGSNTIKLKWTTTNTGVDATFTYDVTRQNF